VAGLTKIRRLSRDAAYFQTPKTTRSVFHKIFSMAYVLSGPLLDPTRTTEEYVTSVLCKGKSNLDVELGDADVQS